MTIPKAGGGTWECTFDDDFDGTTIDTSRWTVQDPSLNAYHSGRECFVDSPNNVWVGDGSLHLTVRKEASGFRCGAGLTGRWTQYTSGMVSTYGTFAQVYGRVEVRAALPAATVRGLQESFWLFPVTQDYGRWPASGEIDFAEAYSRYPDRVVPYVHYNADGSDPNATNTNCFIEDLAKFHTYAVEWTAEKITVLYDGSVCLVDSWNPRAPQVKPQPFDKPFFLLLTQALGMSTNSFFPSITPLPATTTVDYVRIWR